jgi:hypothetical protein
MHGLLAISLSFFLSLSALGAEAEPAWRSAWNGLPELIPLLGSVPEGQKILSEARAKDPDFLAKVHRGEVSFTESTFARSYSLLDGKEQIELKHEITISKKLSLSDAVVDLAHELVHFTEKEMLDPYKPGFELKQFVKRGIEGQGGELSALKRECEVAWALKRKFEGFPSHRLCAPYQSAGGGFDEAKALRDYYALGRWFGGASAELKAELPVTSGKVVFTSSYAGKPYPVALAEEFVATREVACANNRRKYKLIAAQADSGRSPASLLQRERRRLRNYDLMYCASTGVAAKPVAP